ncbi:GALT8-like protein [Mya arenaria]|uniref:GALT8-like protein n=1 Tax=Mya arenaria TaxID=6604 RepID=A0ABY7EJD7_MYAAR|nr:GALT8-like protein [Mya arenaria]
MRESVGLMVARQAGIDSARADYFVCMDCHVEPVTGWLEPLLQRLVENPKACLQSNVGIIRRDNFATEFKWKQTTFPMFLFMLDEIHEPYRKEFLEGRNTSEPIPYSRYGSRDGDSDEEVVVPDAGRLRSGHEGVGR